MAITKTIEIDVNSLQAVGGLKNLDEALKQVDKSAKSVDATFEEVYGDLQPLTSRMGEAEDRLYELALAGQSASREYQDLLATVGNYRQVQIRTDMAVDAAATTFDTKLGGALQGVTSGFAGVQGVMALTGTQSGELEEAILKVQGAMALTEGIRGVRESVNSFKSLSTVIKSTTIFQKVATAAQWLWNAAMSANPIGAIIVAITALIAGGYALVKMFRDSSEANEQAAAATKRNEKALQEQTKAAEKGSTKLQEYNKYQYDMAKASGASSEQLRKLALKHKDEEIALNQKNTMLARSTFLRERDTLASLKAADASDDVIAAQEKLTQDTYKEFNKQREGYYKSKEEKVALVRQQNVELKTEQTNANKTASEKQKEANEKAKELAKKAKEDKIKQEEEAKNKAIEAEKQKKEALERIRLAEIDTQAERRAEELRQVQEQYRLLIEEADKYQKNTTALKEAQRTKEKELQDKFAAEDKEREAAKKLKEQEKKIVALELTKEFDNLTFEAKREELKNKENLLLQDKTLTEEQRKNLEKSYANERTKIAQAEAEAKKAIQDASFDVASQGIGLIKGLFEKNKGVQKAAMLAESALGIAKIIVNTQTANAVASASPLNAVDPTYGIRSRIINTVSAGIGIAANIAATAKGLAALGGGGAPSGGNVGGAGGGAAAPAPQFNVVGNTGVNQLAQTLGNQQPIQAFVVANQVTTQQALDRNILNNASIG